MAYGGNMWDHSSLIMGDQRGYNFAHGIQQAGAGFAQGVQRYFQKEEERKKQEATVQWLEQSGAANNLFPQLAQIRDPAERKKIITAGIKGAGLENMLQVAQLHGQMERQKMEAEALNEMRRTQAEENAARARKLEFDMDAARREEGALAAAFDPIQESQREFAARGGYITRDRAAGQLQERDPTPPEMVARYGRAGGRNPQVMKQLGEIAPENMSALQFQQDPVTGERFAVSKKGSFAKSGINPDAKGAKSFNDGPQISKDKKFYRSGPGEPWKPIKAEGKLSVQESAELAVLPEEISQLEQSIAAAAKESRAGNKKPGPDWMPGTKTHDERIATMQQELQQKKQRLAEIRKRQGSETDDEVEESRPSATRQPMANPLDYVLGVD